MAGVGVGIDLHKPSNRAVAIAIGTTALGLRLFRADAQSLWYDEGTSAALALRPPADILAAAANDIHPPLYYLLLSIWARAFGDGVISLRGLSAVIGAIGAVGVWALARRVAGPRIAALAGLFAATSPFLVWYGQEVRMYVLAGALGAWLPLVALRVIEGRRRRRRWVGEGAEIEPEGERGTREAAAAGGSGATGGAGGAGGKRATGGAGVRTRRSDQIDSVLAIALTTAALYTHYAAGAAVVLGANAVAAAAISRRWRLEGAFPLRASGPWIVTQTISAALFVPWLMRAWPTISAWPALGDPLGILGIARGTIMAYGLGVRVPEATAAYWPVFGLGVGVAVAIAISAVFRRRREVGAMVERDVESRHLLTSRMQFGLTRLGFPQFSFTVVVACALAIAPPMLLLILERSRPAWDPKFLIGGAAGFEILLAGGVLWIAGAFASRARAGRLWATLGPIAAGSLVALILLPRAAALRAMYFDPAFQRDDYRGIVAEIAAAAGPEDAVILVAPTQVEVFDYYARGTLLTLPLPRERPPNYASLLGELNAIGRTQRDLFAVLWAVEDADPENRIEKWLGMERLKAYERWSGSVRLARWSAGRPSSESPPSALPEPIVFGGQVALEELHLGALDATAGDVVTFIAHWRAVEASDGVRPRPDLVVLTQLLDPNGTLIAQRDMRPVAGTQATSTWGPDSRWRDRIALEVPRGTPPGQYALILGLYDPRSGERWAPDEEAVGAGGFSVRDGALEIGRVQVRGGAKADPHGD